MLMDGDDYDIDNMYAFLKQEGFCDEEGFEIIQDENDSPTQV